MTYRCAVEGQMCEDGKCYDEMPEKLKEHFRLMDYKEIVRTLIVRDFKRGRTVQELANQYRLTYKEARGIVENFAR